VASVRLHELRIGDILLPIRKNKLLDGHDALLGQKQREKDRAAGVAGDIMLNENTELDFCESGEEILAVLQESGVTAPKAKKPKQGLPKDWKGHYCKVCQRQLANERFPGKGHKAHICTACASRLKAERKAANKERLQSKTE
jgi:hypothetical protein